MNLRALSGRSLYNNFDGLFHGLSLETSLRSNLQLNLDCVFTLSGAFFHLHLSAYGNRKLLISAQFLKGYLAASFALGILDLEGPGFFLKTGSLQLHDR